MKSAVLFATTLALLATMAVAQTCPCKVTPGRTVVAYALSGYFEGQPLCEQKVIPSTCHCVYDGTEDKICPMSEANAWLLGADENCALDSVLVPQCDLEPETVERVYLCANAVVTQGASSFDCVMPIIPCDPIVDARLEYYQYANYTASISFGPGVTQFQADVTVVNVPSPASYFVGSLPGAEVTGSGIIFAEEGIITQVHSFEANATFLTAPAAPPYIDALQANCNKQQTVFTVRVEFNSDNRNANFDDSSPLGLIAVTGMSVVVRVLVSA